MSFSELELFSSEVVAIMPLMVREFAKLEDNDLTRGKISCPQMVALDLVSSRGRAKLSDVSSTLNVQTSSASVLVSRLERQGMLRRRHDADDRRVVWITATPKGRKVVSQIMAQKRRSIRAIFGTLTARERGQYLSVLLKVKQNLLKGHVLVKRTAVMFLAAAVLAQAAPAHAFFWKKKPAASKAVTAVAQAAPLTLDEAYRLALARSESLASQKEEIALAQARFLRSLGYFLPTALFRMTRFERDVDDDFAPSSSGEGVSGDSRRRVTPENKFVFSQPIFSGFKEIAALRATGADKNQQRLKYRRAEELLFVDVMEAFYAVRQAEEDVRTLETISKLLVDRMGELDERVNLGRSRGSEKQTSLADQKLAEADLVIVRAAAETARNLLEFYIGRDLDGATLADEAPAEGLAGLDFYIDKSASRADVRAAEEGLRVKRQGVVSAQAGFFPTVTLDGNYYTRRVGFQEGNDWDILFTVDVPLFDAGETMADVKEAAVARERAELDSSLARRTAELEVRNAYEDLRSARLAETAFDEAGRAAEENYKIHSEEYRLNLVSNLDVLDALRRYQDIVRRANEARYDARRAHWKFRVALGDVEVPGIR